MGGVADILGIVAIKKDPKVAILRCNGSCEFRPKTNIFDGALSCAIAASLYSGDTGCQYGCLGCGDCVVACDFDAIHMNPVTGLPEVVDEKCVACGACVKACPKTLIELRKKAPKDRKIYVACRNQDTGGIARKSCAGACIGCGKCEKECKYDAITMGNNLAFIDADKCKLCRKCVSVCPTNSIVELTFPPRKITVTDQPAVAPGMTKEAVKEGSSEPKASEI
jgi:ferredoxin